jgi:hypothetical protein
MVVISNKPYLTKPLRMSPATTAETIFVFIGCPPMCRDEVKKGVLVRLLAAYSNVPVGTWATVDSTGTTRDGDWWFTVKWHHYRPIPERFPHGVVEYSLNLWEQDLALFESISPR